MILHRSGRPYCIAMFRGVPFQMSLSLPADRRGRIARAVVNVSNEGVTKLSEWSISISLPELHNVKRPTVLKVRNGDQCYMVHYCVVANLGNDGTCVGSDTQKIRHVHCSQHSTISSPCHACYQSLANNIKKCLYFYLDRLLNNITFFSCNHAFK